MKDVFIVGTGLVTPAGDGVDENCKSLIGGKTFFKQKNGAIVAEVSKQVESQIVEVRKDQYFRDIDRSAILAILASRQAIKKIKNTDLTKSIVMMGTSRGFENFLGAASKLFDKENTIKRYTGAISHTGCLSAAVAKDIQSKGITLTVSSACSSGLHSVGLATALLKQDMGSTAVVGGADSALSKFVLAQLKDLGVLSNDHENKYPCRPLDPYRSGTVFGEGASALALSVKPTAPPLAKIVGYGGSVENGLKPGTTQNGFGLQEAIGNALTQAKIKPSDIDVIVGHLTGTQVGDSAEFACYQTVFGGKLPTLTFNKWCLSHLMGASGVANTTLACEIFSQKNIHTKPYLKTEAPWGREKNIKPRYILVTSLGYGGNAAVLILERPKDT